MHILVRVCGCVRKKKREREMLNHLCIFAHDCVCLCVSQQCCPLEGPSFPLGETLTALVLSAMRVIIEMVS